MSRTRTAPAKAVVPTVQATAYVPFHLKYRPQTFAKVVGQEPVVQALTHAITQGRIAPAYLFEGVRGTGKTSSARILAKSLNCEQGPTPTPCGQCSSCRSIAAGSDLDVIEIDAASNTGVDNIRQLVEGTQLVPLGQGRRVWIIDEVHKLSNAAMNALLKTLEEPPQRVVFILATTEPEKVLPTIISRCQRYRFGRIELGTMVAHLSQIAELEGIEVQPEALMRIAQASGGGLRDAQSLLDQVSLLPPPVTVEAVDWITGAVPEQALLKMLIALLEIGPGDNLPDELLVALLEPTAVGAPEVRLVAQAQELQVQGITPMAILEGLARMVQLLLQAKYTDQPPRLSPVTPQTWASLQALAKGTEITTLRRVNALLRGAEAQIRQAHQPQIWLEALLIELIEAATEG